MKLDMDEDVRTEWVAALRSGKYEQRQGVLRKGDKFCCLGVLCDLAVKKGIIPEPEVSGDIYFYGDSDIALPEPVQEWVGLYGNEGEPGYRLRVKVGEQDYSNLAAANDNGRTFAEIADAIEDDSVVIGPKSRLTETPIN